MVGVKKETSQPIDGKWAAQLVGDRVIKRGAGSDRAGKNLTTNPSNVEVSIMAASNLTPVPKPHSDDSMAYSKTELDGPHRLSNLGDGVQGQPGVVVGTVKFDGDETDEGLAITAKLKYERVELGPLKTSLQQARSELYSLISLTAILSSSQINLEPGPDGDVQIDGFMVADVFSQIRDRLSGILGSLDEEINRF